MIKPEDSFWIGAFGNPQDGYAYRGSSEVVNVSSIRSITFTNFGVQYQFCLKGNYNYNANYSSVKMTTSVCNSSLAVICQKSANTISNSTGSVNILSIKMDPLQKKYVQDVTDNMIQDFKALFRRLNKTSSYKNFFSMLWYSSLPCFDLNGVTSSSEGEKSLLKSCYWRGKQISCAAIFDTFPTDQGMCCSFNMQSAEEIFKKSDYTKMVMDKQEENNFLSLTDFTPPSWYLQDQKEAFSGISKGLRVVVDVHNDLLSRFSINSDFQGLTAVVANKGSYPLTRQAGFQLRPGHFNFVGLSATKISAEDAIKSLLPSERNCMFKDETSSLKIHSEYSMNNCLLECSINYAQNQLANQTGQPCAPWFLPTMNSTGTICDPWEAENFEDNFNTVPDGTCMHCLPDCNTVLYETSVTAVPFRRCDFRNLGVSALCSVDVPLPPSPQIWSKQVIEVLQKTSLSTAAMLANLGATSSVRNYHISLAPEIAFNSNDSYDAYEKDIAVVDFFFKTPSVIEFNTDVRLTWIDFFSAIGGLLGLCIGISIVTFIELFWLGFRLAANSIRPTSSS